MAYKVLVLEDNETDAALMEEYLDRSSHNFKVMWVATGSGYEKAIHTFEPDVILCDYRLKAYSGIDAIQYKKQHCNNVPLVIVSGTIGEEKAVEMIKEGAADFLIKKSIENRLSQTLMRAIQESMEKQKRRKAENKLKKSEERFRMLFEHSLDGIIIGNPSKAKERIITANDAACEMLGYNSLEIKELPLDDFLNIDAGKTKQEVEKRNETGLFRGQAKLKRADGSNLPVEVSSRILKLNDGEKRSYYIIRDISDLLKAKQKLQNSLDEKKTLLTEIHHRVKNNLAVISGIMELQAMKSDNEELRSKLFDSQSRIKSIAITHELLYEEQNFSNINYGANIRNLVNSIASAMNTEIDFHFNLDNLKLSINQALPCSLILNELVTNALRHAFDGEEKPIVDISLREKNGNIHLQVRDNGKGLPDNLDLNNPRTVGFKLISILTKQLDGEAEFNTNSGTMFTLTFQKSPNKGSGNSISTENE